MGRWARPAGGEGEGNVGRGAVWTAGDGRMDGWMASAQAGLRLLMGGVFRGANRGCACPFLAEMKISKLHHFWPRGNGKEIAPCTTGLSPTTSYTA